MEDAGGHLAPVVGGGAHVVDRLDLARAACLLRWSAVSAVGEAPSRAACGAGGADRASPPPSRAPHRTVAPGAFGSRAATRAPFMAQPGPEGTWRAVRLALGLVAATPVLAPRTAAAVEGASPTAETSDRAADMLREEIQPIDDVRSTADYRREVAARVLHRLIRDEGGW